MFQWSSVSDIAISIDTRNAAVAQAAILAGADIVNDVSGGCHDPDMLKTVAQLGVPFILMHMRGTPQTMQTMTNYEQQTTVASSNNVLDPTTNSRGPTPVVDEVARVLRERVHAAQQAGIPEWLQVVDPGIGFAKDGIGNLQLLKHISHIRSSLKNRPILLGTSRKGFLGKLTGVTHAPDRDVATVASLLTPACFEAATASGESESDGPPNLCTIWRVHNVTAASQALKIMNAIEES